MANGPRVFYCSRYIDTVTKGRETWRTGECKISARGPKSAAEVYVMMDCPEVVKYKPGVVRINVREANGRFPDRVFAITCTVTAKEVRGGLPQKKAP